MITYEIVKNPAKKGSNLEPVIISSNREVGGKIIGRYIAGFQIGADESDSSDHNEPSESFG